MLISSFFMLCFATYFSYLTRFRHISLFSVFSVLSGSLLTYLFPDNNGTRQVFAVDLPKLVPLPTKDTAVGILNAYNIFPVEEPEVHIGTYHGRNVLFVRYI